MNNNGQPQLTWPDMAKSIYNKYIQPVQEGIYSKGELFPNRPKSLLEVKDKYVETNKKALDLTSEILKNRSVNSLSEENKPMYDEWTNLAMGAVNTPTSKISPLSVEEQAVRNIKIKPNVANAGLYDANPVVNQKTGETLNQAIERLRKYEWSEKSITDYKNAILGKTKPIIDNPNELNSLNPTGGVFVDYSPQKRATMPLGADMTTLDKTMGKSPNETITIYRGVSKDFGQTDIKPGDFITTNPELAKTYAGDGNVISKKVKLSDVLDSKSEPGLGEESIYRPSVAQQPLSVPSTKGVAK